LNSGMFCFRPVFCLKNQGHPEGIWKPKLVWNNTNGI
jgi:hypothetical protein